jgi:hypothetical protein
MLAVVVASGRHLPMPSELPNTPMLTMPFSILGEKARGMVRGLIGLPSMAES